MVETNVSKGSGHTVSSKTLYSEIKHYRSTGMSYGAIGKLMLPDIHPSAAKSIVYRFFVKHQPINDNAIRDMLGIERLYEVRESDIKGKAFGLKSPPRPHRVAIYTSAEHIEKILASMRNHMTPDLLDEIKRRL